MAGSLREGEADRLDQDGQALSLRPGGSLRENLCGLEIGAEIGGFLFSQNRPGKGSDSQLDSRGDRIEKVRTDCEPGGPWDAYRLEGKCPID